MYRYLLLVVVVMFLLSLSFAQSEENKEAYEYCIEVVKEGSMIGMASDAVVDLTGFIETFDDRYDSVSDAAFICWEFAQPYVEDAGKISYEFGTVVVDKAGEAWIASKPYAVRGGSESTQFLEKKLEQSGAVLQAGWEVTREDVYPVLRDDVLPVVIEQSRRFGKWIEKQLNR